VIRRIRLVLALVAVAAVVVAAVVVGVCKI